MMLRTGLLPIVTLWAITAHSPSNAQSVTPLCQPVVGDPQTVTTPAQRQAAGMIAIPPLTDRQNGFAWPDSEFGVIPTASGYAFFASDGAHHDPNNKYGSVTRTLGTLDNPLGNSPPVDVIIHPNPNPAIDPNYAAFTYLGGGRIYLVPAGQPGAGNLLDVYHAEINTETSFYSLLGLAVSTDDGYHWTDLGEIIRPNQPYQSDLGGFDIGSPRLVDSPDGRYFYVYFPDWIANGTTQPTTSTLVSVARAAKSSVLQAAFGASPHAAPFEKYYEQNWNQPGIGGLSTDLNPDAPYGGSSNVAYNPAIQRYVSIADDTVHISYAESPDGLSWTLPVLLKQDTYSQTSFNYAVPIGTGPDPNLLGQSFYVFFTYGSPQGWPGNAVERFTVSCPAQAAATDSRMNVTIASSDAPG